MIRVQEADFDAAALHAQVRAAGAGEAGALVSFTGYVRDFAPETPTQTLFLEHYPGMCERVLRELGETARARWNLSAYAIVHRVGALQRSEQIVFVATACAHRGDAFRACEYLIDALKTRAPFWKREALADGRTFWVQQKDADRQRSARWHVRGNTQGATP